MSEARNEITTQIQHHLNAIQDLLLQLNKLDNDDSAVNDNVNDYAVDHPQSSASFLSFAAKAANSSTSSKKKNKTASALTDYSVPLIGKPEPKARAAHLRLILLSQVASVVQASIKNMLQQAIGRDVMWSSGDAVDWRCDAQIYVFVPDMGRFSSDQCLPRLKSAAAAIDDDVASDKLQFIIALSTSTVESFPLTTHGIPVLPCRVDPSTTALQPDQKHFVSFAGAVQAQLKNRLSTE